ncbi:MAG: SMC-Scp complex subunit ScpB [Thermoflexales bacterium]|nr:SMC-Scp complex subunit ScpB [Thermoflexales bacterium]
MNEAELASSTQELALPALIESLLFVADEPVSVARLAQATEASLDQVEAALAILATQGMSNVPNAAGNGSGERGLRLQRKGERVQLATHPSAAPAITRFLGLELSSKLSAAALETLAIVAYRQPCTRSQIEAVRGVNCDSVLKNLLSKGLVEEVGRLETVGHPILYGTTFEFLQHFGLSNLSELPPLLPEEAEKIQEMARPRAEADQPAGEAGTQSFFPANEN